MRKFRYRHEQAIGNSDMMSADESWGNQRAPRLVHVRAGLERRKTVRAALLVISQAEDS
jgi:hypothetical protein